MRNTMAKRTPRSEASDSATASADTERTRSRRKAGGDAGTPTPSESIQRSGTAESTESALDPQAPAESQKPATRVQQEMDGRGVATPTAEEIRLRAYHRYLERGGGHGMDFDDWVEAERELTKK
jgi:Protein of unknown function (DUF2934)